MDELTKGNEESAPVTEVVKEGEDISKKYTPTQMAQMRQAYIKDKKSEIEILKVDTEAMELQIHHYDLSKRIAQINAEIAAVKEKKSQEFAQSLKP